MNTNALPIAAEQAVYEFLVAFKIEHDGNTPTRREIMEACGITSTSVVNYYLDRLERKGLIEQPRNGASRMIVVTGGCWQAPCWLAAEQKEARAAQERG